MAVKHRKQMRVVALLAPEQLAAIEKMASTQDRSVAYILRQAVKGYLQQPTAA